jgi:uncharacterized protein (DUF4415 family)
MAAKKKTTSRVSDAFSAKERPAPAAAKKAAAEVTGDIKRKPGRPKADHNLKRTTILSDPDLMRHLKKIALDEDCHLYEVVNEAFRDHIKRKG